MTTRTAKTAARKRPKREPTYCGCKVPYKVHRLMLEEVHNGKTYEDYGPDSKSKYILQAVIEKLQRTGKIVRDI